VRLAFIDKYNPLWNDIPHEKVTCNEIIFIQSTFLTAAACLNFFSKKNKLHQPLTSTKGYLLLTKNTGKNFITFEKRMKFQLK